MRSAAHRMYRFLLALYPPGFRARYGREMEVVFARTLERERLARGGVGACVVVLGAVRDTLGRAAVEWADAIVSTMRIRQRQHVRFGDRLMFLLQDVRYAVRGCAKRPGFTVVAMLTLAVGIGANTAMFSVVNGILLRPLPYDDPDRLVLIWETFERAGMTEVPFSEADFIDFRDQTETLSHIAMFRNLEDAVLVGDGEPEVLNALMVTPSLFPMLGARAQLGRVFDATEEQPDESAVAVLSDALWRQRYGADPSVLGTTINLSDRDYTVVGVMPPGFQFPPPVSFGDLMISMEPDLWVPFPLDRANADRERHGYFAMGRARGDVELALVDAEMKALAARVAEANPATNTGIGARAVPVHEQSVASVRSGLLALLGAVGFVLLIACTNVANLLLARAGARQREVAVRMAVGAGRGRLVGQLLTESMLLAVVGGGVGFVLSIVGTRALFRLNPMDLPVMFDAAVDLRVLTFSFAVTALTGVAFGLIPALHSTNAELREGLGEGGRSTGGRGQLRMKNILIVGEIALALVLLIGAGLMIRSFDRLQRVNPGFDPENVLSFLLPLSQARYPEEERQRVFIDAVTERIKALPGVHAVGAVSNLPLVAGRTGSNYTVEGEPPPEPGEYRIAEFRSITPGYLEAMRMPLLAGRAFAVLDGPDAQPVAIVNETLARRHWEGDDAIGKTITGGTGDSGPRTIVGIVSDVRFFGVDAPVEPMVYRPNAQVPNRGMWVAVRATGDPVALGGAVRAAVWEIDPTVPVEEMETMRSRFAESIAKPRFTAQLFSGFGMVALFLAAIGIYGVMSFAVSERTRDIGIRMAFGARPRSVLALVLRRGLFLASAGVGLGLIGALGATRLLRNLLFDVSPTDPVTFGLVAAALLGVAVVATYLPARRATKVDPMEALRGE